MTARVSRMGCPDFRRPREAWPAVIVLSLLVFVSGCAVGPDYRRPEAAGTNAMPNAFSAAGQGAGANRADWKAAEPAAHLPRGAWWTLFGEDELNRLESLATEGNQELSGAVARFAQARAQANVARSDFFPYIKAAPSVTRERYSQHGTRGFSERNGATDNSFSVPLDATWEPDFWGRVRRQVESAKARLDAAADDTEAVKLRIQAEVAIDYFALRSLEAETALLERAVENFSRSLDLTRNRRAGGVASDLDVSQAETQLRAVEAELPAAQLQAARLRHALATLCGRPSTGLEISKGGTNLANPPFVPASLPSELLERRPDIAAAERRMAAANAEVGVAKTAFYPRVLVRGFAGFQSIDAGTLFDWPSRVWAVGPSLELPLFAGGRNRARLGEARARYDETVAHYRQTTLSAFEEVENQLSAQSLLAAQLGSEQAALDAAQRTFSIANNRYKAGLVTYLEVATAQSAALARERVANQIAAQRLIAAVSLAKALGGGWTPAKP